MEELEEGSKVRLMVEFQVDSQQRRFELFNISEFEAFLESLTKISEDQGRIFATELKDSTLTQRALTALCEDLDIRVDEIFCVGSGWNYPSIFGMMARLKQKIDILHSDLVDDYFNQDLEVGQSLTRLKWPESARYLRQKLTILERVHAAYLREITDKDRFEFSIQFPGLSLLTQSHTTWIDGFESHLNAKKTSKEKYDTLVQMKAVLSDAIDKSKPKYREVDDVATEYVPGIKSLPNEWYEITSNGIEKHSHHSPDLAAIVTWLERKILAAIPVFTIKQGKYGTPADAKSALTSKVRRLFVETKVEVSPHDDFIDSNFRMAHESSITKQEYCFSVTKLKNVKEFTERLLDIFNKHVTEKNKVDILLWLHIHVGEIVTYKTLTSYIYHSSEEITKP